MIFPSVEKYKILWQGFFFPNSCMVRIVMSRRHLLSSTQKEGDNSALLGYSL